MALKKVDLSAAKLVDRKPSGDIFSFPLTGDASPGTFKLGPRLKKARQDKNWTLDEASQRTGVSRSTLSKVENGAMSPTFDILQKIAFGMKLDIVEFFETNRPSLQSQRRSITRAGEGRDHLTPTYVHHLLATDLVHKKMLPFRTTITAHRLADFEGWIKHDGEEFLYVLSGAVEVHTEFYASVILNPGDSTYFDSKMGHAVTSASEGDAEVLWVVSDALSPEA